MRKTTIFVEGWTEQAWVREYLLKWHGYEEAWIECYALFNEKGMHSTPYPHKPVNPLFHYQIINVGGDSRVNNALVKETPRLRNEGFHRIIGLRDMLSETYRDLVDAHKVDNDVIEKIQSVQWNAIERLLSKNTKDVRLCYAIMETEAWVLGLSEFFEMIDERLTHDFIQKNLNLNLKTLNPETDIYNPATTLNRVFNLVGKSYGKKQGEIDALISPLNRNAYESFLERDKCNSFNVFHDAIHSE